MTPLGRVVDSLLKRTLIMRETLRATSEPKLLAEVVAAFPANAAGIARHTDLEGNSIPNTKAGDVGTNTNYNTRGFVAQGQRLTGSEIAIRELFIV